MKLLDLWMMLLNKDAEWFETDLRFMDKGMNLLQQGVKMLFGILVLLFVLSEGLDVCLTFFLHLLISYVT
jgi:hypothetical protein